MYEPEDGRMKAEVGPEKGSNGLVDSAKTLFFLYSDDGRNRMTSADGKIGAKFRRCLFPSSFLLSLSPPPLSLSLSLSLSLCIHDTFVMLSSENTHSFCKGKYHYMADLLFDWLRFSCFDCVELDRDLQVWKNPNQSNRSVVQ